MGNAHLSIISNSDTWLEGNAVQQLHHTAALNGMLRVAGMPDLHAGRGYPVGAAFFSAGVFYPALIGNDIGCGMALWQTGLSAARAKADKLAKQLGSIDAPLDESWHDRIAELLPNHPFQAALGTIGGGNHFAELQRTDAVFRADLLPDRFAPDRLQLLVHSGSRGLGQQILRRHVDAHGHGGLPENSAEAAAYLTEHADALAFARANRRLIAERMLARWRTDGACLLDAAHNFLQTREVAGRRGWLHRKGASPADEGLLVIPGSRGDYSYLVRPLPEAARAAEALYSLAHGAGRKWRRGECKGRLSHKFSADSLRRTALGGVVVCADKALIYEEAPQAYKNIDSVVNALRDAGLIEAVARLRPVLTYKTSGACC